MRKKRRVKKSESCESYGSFDSYETLHNMRTNSSSMIQMQLKQLYVDQEKRLREQKKRDIWVRKWGWICCCCI